MIICFICYGVNLTKVVSLVLIALILISLASYVSVAMSVTITSLVSKRAFEAEEKLFARKSAVKPPFLVPLGDPIDDPKPNSQ